MASSSSRSLPAASSSALLSASFPGPGLWRRRRMLVGCVVVVGLACQAVVGVRVGFRNLTVASYLLQIVLYVRELAASMQLFCVSFADAVPKKIGF